MQMPQHFKTLLDKEVLPTVKFEVIDYKTGKPVDPKEMEKLKAAASAANNVAPEAPQTPVTPASK
jgi:hypothetical protein